jgi:hypothetical protein
MSETLFPLTLDDQIKCVEREIAMRKNVYPRRVEAQKMSPNKMRYEIEAMQAVLTTLLKLKEGA